MHVLLPGVTTLASVMVLALCWFNCYAEEAALTVLASGAEPCLHLPVFSSAVQQGAQRDAVDWQC
jgi:hypothetical protein